MRGSASAMPKSARARLLTGQIRRIEIWRIDYRTHPGGENFQKNSTSSARSRRWREKGCTPAQFAWPGSSPKATISFPFRVPSVARLRNMAPNVRITPEDRARIDRICPRSASGTRYAAPQMQALNR